MTTRSASSFGLGLLVLLSLFAGCADNRDQPVLIGSACGNGRVDPDERCDVDLGDCPTSCDDGVACTSDQLLGTQCSAHCEFSEIVTCAAGDGCCPAGCSNATDSDCSAKCGDGTVQAPETCDTAIGAGQSGACPASCDDGVACTRDELVGAGCSVACSHASISACTGGDGCCPAACNAANDSDCSASCGNGVVEAPEVCDTAITNGPGACPSSCNDTLACTRDELVGAGCSSACSHSAITTCTTGDGCCPAACNGNTDADCSASCGNGVVEPGEKCDTAIAMGAGVCPSGCDDGVACTLDALVGSGCSAECSHTQVSTCSGGDGCCPAGCDLSNDSDCSSCPTGQHACSGLCVSSCSLTTCGTNCGTPCTAPAHATPSCDCSACGFSCDSGYVECSAAPACQLSSGDGSDGGFNTALIGSDGANDQLLPPGITRSGRIFEVDTELRSTFQFSQVLIATGDTLRGKAKNKHTPPLTLLVTGSVQIDGAVALDATAATDETACGSGSTRTATAGLAGPGGYPGGTPNQAGPGPGGGGVGFASGDPGCGAGHAGPGLTSTTTGLAKCTPGVAYGQNLFDDLVGGSGGGAGRKPSGNAYAGAGGGGGGALRIVAAGTITLSSSGSISVRGAQGSRSSSCPSSSACGGGGSGGRIHLESAMSVAVNGSLDASRDRGFWTHWNAMCAPGAMGRILISTPSGSFAGTGSILPPAATETLCTP